MAGNPPPFIWTEHGTIGRHSCVIVTASWHFQSGEPTAYESMSVWSPEAANNWLLWWKHAPPWNGVDSTGVFDGLTECVNEAVRYLTPVV